MEQYWALYKELTLSHLRLLYWERTRRSIVNGKITVKRAREKEKSEMVVMDSPVSGRMADQNIDPNTTTSPSPIEKHVSAIKAISGDEKAPSKEKKNYASKKSTTVIQKSHCFQNSWTFWFDNPSSKSNQVIWGSSLRSLYTFATIEEFWR